jgi:hypothetical protein
MVTKGRETALVGTDGLVYKGSDGAPVLVRPNTFTSPAGMCMARVVAGSPSSSQILSEPSAQAAQSCHDRDPPSATRDLPRQEHLATRMRRLRFQTGWRARQLHVLALLRSGIAVTGVPSRSSAIAGTYALLTQWFRR